MLDKKYLRTVPLPQDLTNDQIFSALKATQELFRKIRKDAGIVLSDIIQSNNFGGIVSNVFTQKLSDISSYKLYKDDRFPDLKHEQTGEGLEVKSSVNPLKGGEGHNGHTGWHIVVCYMVLETGDIEFTQAEIAYLNGFEEKESDWKYLGSKRNSNKSQRTETYSTTDKGTAKLRDGSVYLNTEYVKISNQLQRARERVELSIPNYSPFYK